jgi:hypothetical protein
MMIDDAGHAGMHYIYGRHVQCLLQGWRSVHPVPSLGSALLVLTCLFVLGLGISLPLLVAQLQVCCRYTCATLTC